MKNSITLKIFSQIKKIPLKIFTIFYIFLLFSKNLIFSADFESPFPPNSEISTQIKNQTQTEIQTQNQQNSLVTYKTLDLPGALRSEVEPFRNQYLTSYGENFLRSVLENGESYRLYVRAELKKRNMPATLEYLPIVESDYIPHAVSKDGKGVGMWQFMPNSVEPFLELNQWIDERLDPWKETEAALLKLTDNYNMFGDWLIAIAAYNCGAGAMSVALKKSGAKTFWEVAKTSYIPEHTKRYIPKLLAVADLVENAEYYELDLPSGKHENGNPVNPWAGEFDYVEIPKEKSPFPLRSLSTSLRIDMVLLEELNPALLYKMTPPGKSYKIRLPKGMSQSVIDYLNSLND